MNQQNDKMTNCMVTYKLPILKSTSDQRSTFIYKCDDEDIEVATKDLSRIYICMLADEYIQLGRRNDGSYLPRVINQHKNIALVDLVVSQNNRLKRLPMVMMVDANSNTARSLTDAEIAAFQNMQKAFYSKITIWRTTRNLGNLMDTINRERAKIGLFPIYEGDTTFKRITIKLIGSKKIPLPTAVLSGRAFPDDLPPVNDFNLDYNTAFGGRATPGEMLMDESSSDDDDIGPTQSLASQNVMPTSDDTAPNQVGGPQDDTIAMTITEEPTEPETPTQQEPTPPAQQDIVQPEREPIVARVMTQAERDEIVERARLNAQPLKFPDPILADYNGDEVALNAEIFRRNVEETTGIALPRTEAQMDAIGRAIARVASTPPVITEPAVVVEPATLVAMDHGQYARVNPPEPEPESSRPSAEPDNGQSNIILLNAERKPRKYTQLHIFGDDGYWSRRHENVVERPLDARDVPDGTLIDITPRMRDGSHRFSYWHPERLYPTWDTVTPMRLWEVRERHFELLEQNAFEIRLARNFEMPDDNVSILSSDDDVEMESGGSNNDENNEDNERQTGNTEETGDGSGSRTNTEDPSNGQTTTDIDNDAGSGENGGGGGDGNRSTESNLQTTQQPAVDLNVTTQQQENEDQEPMYRPVSPVYTQEPTTDVTTETNTPTTQAERPDGNDPNRIHVGDHSIVLEGCFDFKPGTQDPEVAQNAISTAVNMVTTSNLHAQRNGVNIAVNSYLQNAAHDTTKMRGHSYSTEVPCYYRKARRTKRINVKWGPSVEVETLEIPGMDGLSAPGGGVSSRNLLQTVLSRFTSDRNYIERITNSVTLGNRRYDNSGLYMKGVLLAANLADNEHMNSQLPPEAPPAQRHSIRLRANMAEPLNTWSTKPEQADAPGQANLYCSNCATEAYWINVKGWSNKQISALRMLAVASDALESRNDVHGHVSELISMPAIRIILWSDDNDDLRLEPHDNNLTSDDIRSVLTILSQQHNEQKDFVTGVNSAIILLTGRFKNEGARDDRVQVWVPATLEREVVFHPQPHGYNPMYDVCDWIPAAPAPNVCADEYKVVVSAPWRELRLALAIVGIVFGVGLSMVLNYYNITGRCLNGAMADVMATVSLKQCLQAISRQRGRDLPAQIILSTASVAAQFTALILGTALMPKRSWMNGFVYNEGIPLDNNHGWARMFGNYIPYLFDPLSITFLIVKFPTLWGISKGCTELDLNAEIVRAGVADRMGWYARTGCSQYVVQNSGPQEHRCKAVNYGIGAISGMRQQYQTAVPWRLTFEALEHPNPTGIGYIVGDDRYQPQYDPHCYHVRPGTLITFDWFTNEMIIPSLRWVNGVAQMWSLFMNRVLVNTNNYTGLNCPYAPTVQGIVALGTAFLDEMSQSISINKILNLEVNNVKNSLPELANTSNREVKETAPAETLPSNSLPKKLNWGTIVKGVYGKKVPTREIECCDCLLRKLIIYGINKKKIINTLLSLFKNDGITINDIRNKMDLYYKTYNKWNFSLLSIVPNDFEHDINLNPHLCRFTTLEKIEELNKRRWISEDLYNEWMDVNGFDYTICGSKRNLKYWDLRLPCLGGEIRPWPESKIRETIGGCHLNVEIFECHRHRWSWHLRFKAGHGNSFSRSNLKYLNSLFPYSSKRDDNKSNLDLATLVGTCLRRGMFVEVNDVLLLVAVGTVNSMVVALLSHRICNDEYRKMFELIRLDAMCCAGHDELHKYLKHITTSVRRTHSWVDGTKLSVKSVALLSYWEMCIGRSTMFSDWNDEFNNRVQGVINLKPALSASPNKDTNREYLISIRPIVMEIMNEWIDASIRTVEWEEFIRMRNSWAASGSSGGYNIMHRGEKISLRKRSALETIPENEIMNFINTEPKIAGRAFEKFEQSKARAIYGTSLIDYVVISHFLHQFERSLNRVVGVEIGISGIDEVKSLLRRCKITKDEAVNECLMLDFVDFNIQHTLDMQWLVFDCLAECMSNKNVELSIIRSVVWARDAMNNQWTTFPERRGEVKVHQGMFSGIRSTSMMNTVCNAAYLRHSIREVKSLFNIHSRKLNMIHQGDDVWINCDSRLLLMAMYNVVQSNNLKVNATKQIQSKGIGEFLRVMYTPEGTMGYAARSLGTFIERVVQADDDLDPSNRCLSLNNQIMTMYRRGFNAFGCKILWDSTIPYYSRTHLRDTVNTTIPSSVLRSTVHNNGLDLGPPMTYPDKEHNLPSFPVCMQKTNELASVIPKHMTESWVKLLSSKLQIDIRYDVLVEKLHAINVSDSITLRDKLHNVRIYIRQCNDWVDLYQRDLPRIERSEFYMQRWLNTLPPPNDESRSIFSRIFNQMETVKMHERSSSLSVILRCIGTSPFKSLQMAKLALGLNAIAAARIAISYCLQSDLHDAAVEILTFWLQSTSQQVLIELLEQSSAGMGNFLLALFNPVLLSLLNDMATEMTCNYVLNRKVRDLSVVKEVVKYNQKVMVSTAIINNEFMSINHS
ncbi:MAG: RNA-dependent RNA polymerase [Hangzhou paraphaenocladius impensus totivirus 1]|nr:MAG: RNA-dependent RNA polymerase [Hangzhou paraphaenocladius impensus totivirus 1]